MPKSVLGLGVRDTHGRGSMRGMSVAEFRPDLVPSWSDRNDLGPEQVSRGSGCKVWWRGDCGHEWQAPVDNRCYNSTGCPFCADKRVLPGFNDLSTRYPAVAAQWHPTLNEMTADQVMPGTKARAWWVCSDCGREWRAQVKLRTGRGSGCPSCRGRKRGTGTEHPPAVVREWSDRNHLPITEYSTGSRHRAWWVCERGHEWQAAIGDRNTKATRCKQCGAGPSSLAENSLADFVVSLGLSVSRHVRGLSPAFEYDIVVEEKNVILEFNGLYWHNEDHKPGTDYHARKTEAARSAGYQLVHVWEDDWRDRREVVERMVARKLGVSHEPRYNARSLSPATATASEMGGFLDANHIQGAATGSWYGVLRSGDQIVAGMVLKKRGPGGYELVRYATSGVVRGGFSRLFKMFVRDFQPDRVVTFSDRAVSDGSLYELTGFVKDGTIPPDYWYVVKGARVHKFNYRKAKFRSDPGLEYKDGLSEKELARLNGLPRLYDAGKTRWVWYNRH